PPAFLAAFYAPVLRATRFFAAFLAGFVAAAFFFAAGFFFAAVLRLAAGFFFAFFFASSAMEHSFKLEQKGIRTGWPEPFIRARGPSPNANEFCMAQAPAHLLAHSQDNAPPV
ncbi:MAG: hypothetical protein ACKOCR_00640, partial [Burkholderiaceae bacterium]